ncbi:(2Fe-2S) ferredoxin [Escherichia coli]|nr:(2Fe-2S) ferredoxin [Escherichia coli]
MARITLRITGTQLLYRDEHFPFWRRWNPTMWRLSTSAAKVTAVPVARALLQAVDWIAEPLAFIQRGKFCLVVAGQRGDIEIEL